MTTQSVPKDLWANDLSYSLLIDADLQGGASDQTAIVYTTDTPKDGKTGPSQQFLRNVKTSGYRAAVSGQLMTSIDEWTSAPALKAFADSGDRSLNLPVKETPDYSDNNFANWANVMTFGANPSDKEDDTAAFRRQSTAASQRSTFLLLLAVLILYCDRHADCPRQRAATCMPAISALCASDDLGYIEEAHDSSRKHEPRCCLHRAAEGVPGRLECDRHGVH